MGELKPTIHVVPETNDIQVVTSHSQTRYIVPENQFYIKCFGVVFLRSEPVHPVNKSGVILVSDITAQVFYET
jgi:hypothetical protein